MEIGDFNALPSEKMKALLLSWCHSKRWVDGVSKQAPYNSVSALIETSDQVWQQSLKMDVIEAFSGHPKIGDLAALKNKFAETASAEQGQVVAASDAVLERLKSLNDKYLEKFGFIFIVCATGKSAPEMLALLEGRFNNSRERELVNGAYEQSLIMKLRINKYFEAT